MNRKIKFRIWNRKNMILPLENRKFPSSSGEYEITLDGHLLWNDIWVTNRHTIMQFTGLHDCEGREIYEGDILSNRPEIKMIIFWNEKYSQYYGKYYDVSWETPLCTLTSYKIIGNILENPDILDDKK